MDRQIVCFQIPAFEVAVARLEDPGLRQRPVAIAPLHTPRACLHELSSEAEQEGLYTGMRVEHARQLCPSLQILPADPFRVRLAHQHLLDVITHFSPTWEPVRPGYFFLDLTGTGRLFGPAVQTAARIEREVIHRYRLSGVMGVSSNKLVSRVAATLVQPTQLCDVRPGSEQVFLAPLPITVLPGFRESSAKSIGVLLQDLNLRTLGQLAQTSLPQLAVVLGRYATLLHRWANGIDPSPVLPPIHRPAVEVTRTLASDEVDDRQLLHGLYGLLEELCRTLRRQQRVCRQLTLTLLHSDYQEVSRRHSFATGTYWEADMYPCLKNLFFGCFTRRVRIRRTGLRAEVLERPQEQLSLFDGETPESRKQARMQRLSLALDRLRSQFGNNAVHWGTTRVATHGPRAQRKSLQPSLRGCDGERL
jgi:DNA polymerase-4